MKQFDEKIESKKSHQLKDVQGSDFIANDTISVFDNITEKNCHGNNFIKYNNHILLHRQITTNLI